MSEEMNPFQSPQRPRPRRCLFDERVLCPAAARPWPLGCLAPRCSCSCSRQLRSLQMAAVAKASRPGCVLTEANSCGTSCVKASSVRVGRCRLRRQASDLHHMALPGEQESSGLGKSRCRVFAGRAIGAGLSQSAVSPSLPTHRRDRNRSLPANVQTRHAVLRPRTLVGPLWWAFWLAMNFVVIAPGSRSCPHAWPTPSSHFSSLLLIMSLLSIAGGHSGDSGHAPYPGKLAGAIRLFEEMKSNLPDPAPPYSPRSECCWPPPPFRRGGRFSLPAAVRRLAGSCRSAGQDAHAVAGQGMSSTRHKTSRDAVSPCVGWVKQTAIWVGLRSLVPLRSRATHAQHLVGLRSPTKRVRDLDPPYINCFASRSVAVGGANQ